MTCVDILYSKHYDLLVVWGILSKINSIQKSLI